VQAQAEACGYKKLLIDCKLVLGLFEAPQAAKNPGGKSLYVNKS
jgi:hypothetical protein